jgi:hypothetical protein
MRTRSIALLIAGLAGAGVVAAWSFGGSARAGSPSRAPQPFTEAATAESDATARVARTTGDRAVMLGMAAKIDELNERLAQLEQDSKKEPAPPPSAADPEMPAGLERTPYDPKVMNTHAANLDATLERDGTDGSWSPQARAQLEKLFESELPPGASLESVDCGSSFCRVRAAYETAEARETFEQHTMHGAKMGGVALRTERDGRPTSSIYLVRKDEDTPDHPVRRIGAKL